jgi:hypothetical protein
MAFRVPAGKILHIAGQSREDFDDYVASVCRNGAGCPLPAGVALYTDLRLVGLRAPYAMPAKEDNHQDLPYLLGKYSNMVLQVALYVHSTQLTEVQTGKHDPRIKELGSILKSTRRPVFLRIGFEFDGPHSQNEPEAYQKAYQRIVDGIEGTGARNVSYVWHSYALLPTYKNHDPLAWFPGDQYVNWVGISLFFQVTKGSPFEAPNRQRLVDIARKKGLPVMICEASPIRFTPEQKKLQGEDYWNFWFKPFLHFIEGNPEVKAFSIIHCDWDHVSLTKKWGWGNCRLTADPVVQRNWQRMMRNDRFLHSSRDLYRELGFQSTDAKKAQPYAPAGADKPRR